MTSLAGCIALEPLQGGKLQTAFDKTASDEVKRCQGEDKDGEPKAPPLAAFITGNPSSRPGAAR